MANQNKTGLATQAIIAVVVLFVAWILLKWVIKVVFSVATTVVVIGAIIFGVWILMGRDSSD